MTHQELNKINYINVFYIIIQCVLKEFGLCKKLYLPGGRYSGKTFHILLIGIYLCLKESGVIFQIVRRTEKQVKKQKITEVKNTLHLLGCNDYHFNKGELIFTLPNGSIIKLDHLNEEDANPEEGGKLDLPILPYSTKKVITFYEECVELNKILISQHQLSTRSLNRNCKYVFIYACNPYGDGNWFVNECEEILPSNETELAKKGFQSRFDREKGIFLLRTNHLVNMVNVPPEVIAELMEIKALDYERYKVVGLGMPGAVEDAIYQSVMRNRKKFDGKINGIMVGGYDYGWSESDTAMGICFIDLSSRKIKAIHEQGQSHKTIKHGTDEQIDFAIKFYKQYIIKYRQQCKVYIDNSHLGDFYEKFNERLYLHGLSRYELEFLPTKKANIPMLFRVELVKYLIASGILEINDECKGLISDLMNCKWLKPKTSYGWKEGQQRERTHEYTHYLNWFEYALSEFAPEIKSWNSHYYTKGQNEN